MATTGAAVGFAVWSFRAGTNAYEANSHQAGLDLLVAQAGDRRFVTLEFDAHLARGLYRVDLEVFEPSTRLILGQQTGAFVLTVSEHRSQNGVANLYLSVREQDSRSGHLEPETEAFGERAR